VKALVVLHIRYVLSEKVCSFLLFMVIVASFYFVYTIESTDLAMLGREEGDVFGREFVFDMVHFGKLWILVVVLFVLLVAYGLHQYDVIVLNRASKRALETSKLLSMALVIFYMVTMYVLVFVMVVLFFVPFSMVDFSLFGLYLRMLFMALFYMVLFYYLFELSQHILGLVGGFFLYILVFVGSVNDVEKEEIASGMRVLYRVLPDLVYYEKEGFVFYYSQMYYLGLIMGLGILLFLLRKNVDLIN
jgi:hypothetical protein